MTTADAGVTLSLSTRPDTARSSADEDVCQAGPSAGSLLESRTGHLASVDLRQRRVALLGAEKPDQAQGSAPS